MDTAKCVKKSARSGSGRLSLPGSQIGSIDEDSMLSIPSTSNHSSLYLSESESTTSEDLHADFEAIHNSSRQLGRPGIPGSNDLESALRRLTLRKANEINEKHFHEDELSRTIAKAGGEGTSTPSPCHTPESIMSTGSGSNFSDLSKLSGFSNIPFRMPEKLQIVKPMEGSMTLHQWQRLATPHMGGLLEERPGIQIKGERKLDLEEEMYSLSDYEEDGTLLNDASSLPSAGLGLGLGLAVGKYRRSVNDTNLSSQYREHVKSKPRSSEARVGSSDSELDVERQGKQKDGASDNRRHHRQSASVRTRARLTATQHAKTRQSAHKDDENSTENTCVIS